MYEIIGLNMGINSRSTPPTINESMISSRRQLVLMLAVLLLAAGLRWLDLGAGSIWADEANIYWTASQGFTQIFDQTRFILFDPPLYSYFLHFWLKLGMSEFILRFPSLVFSLLGVAGAMAVGYQLGGWRTELLSGFLMAISPTDIRYAQEIGPYALMVSLVFWNYFFLIKISLSKELEWRLLFAWLGLALLATYTHYVAALGVLIPFGVYVLVGVFSKHWKRLFRNVVILFLYGFGSIPFFLYYLPYQLSQAVEKNSLKMGITPSWSLFIDLRGLVVHKVSFLFTGWPFTHIPDWIPFGIVALLFLDNLSTLNRSSEANRIWLIWLTSLFALYSLYCRMDSDPGNFRHGLFFLGMVSSPLYL